MEEIKEIKDNVIVKIEKACYSYADTDEDGNKIGTIMGVDDISLSIFEGEFLALVGRNGSGKSTLAKMLNGLIVPKTGNVVVFDAVNGQRKGFNTKNNKTAFEVRKRVGMVFQNPDNQMIASIVEDDIAFGPENLAVPQQEIVERVAAALESVGMSEYAKRTPSRLSGGQKQRIAIAGVLALKPRILVLDESTAMLDPKGRREVTEVVKRLNKEEKITVVFITHHMEEVVDADRVVVLDKGSIVLHGNPKEVFSQRETLFKAGLDVPLANELAFSLKDSGFEVESNVLSIEELADELRTNGQISAVRLCELGTSEAIQRTNPCAIVEVENLNFVYNPRSPFEKHALKDVNIVISEGDFLSVVGHTGSGKSTFVQHLNGLLRVQKGSIAVNGIDITPFSKRSKRRNKKRERINFSKLRGEVGMVFQYPEYQLFADTVYNDVAFGPKNLKLGKDEIDKRVKEALELVGLDSDYCSKKSPFELSGGEKRRAAIAGVIAMRPKVLILDEPTAGLDPKGKKEILELLLKLKATCSPTIIIISHDMDEVAEYSSRVAVFSDGRIVYDLPPQELFEKTDELLQMGLDIPQLAKLRFILKEQGTGISGDCLSVKKMTALLNEVKEGDINV